MSIHKPAHEIELYRDGAVYTVFVDLPERDPDDLLVRWRDGALHVSVESGDVLSDPSSVYHRRIGVPKAIDESGISASYADGVLKVTLPIVGDRPDRAREIPIE